MPAFVRCKRVRNASALAPCLLAVDRGNGIHIAGHRNRHGAGFCAQLPLTHGPASTCNTGHLFAQEVAFKTNVSIGRRDDHWDWFKRMELGSKVWSNLLATMLSKQHRAAYGSDFLSGAGKARSSSRPKLHPAPPFGTSPGNRPQGGVLRLGMSGVERFPEWKGCWGCVHNDTDQHCCSGRGDCRVGLCMCRDGAFGMDCAHEAEAEATQAGTAEVTTASTAAGRGHRRSRLSSRPSQPRPAAVESTAAAAPLGLRIYVHEMPFELGQTWLASVALPRLQPALWTPALAMCCDPSPLNLL